MSKAKVAVDLFYDVISPYSYIGFEVLCRYRSVWHKMDLRLKPFLIGAVMKDSNNRGPMLVPNKATYMINDVLRLSQYHKIPMKIPMKIPSNFGELVMQKGSLKAMRFITAVDLLTKGEMTENVSREFWKRIFCHDPGLDISEEDNFRELASKVGMNTSLLEQVLQHMQSDETKAGLKQYTAEAIEYGAFGAPTMIVHTQRKPELVFGSDRIEIIGHLIGEKYQGALEAKV